MAFSTQQIELVRQPRLTRTSENDLKLLASQPLFSSLDGVQLAQLTLGSKRVRFGKGERIIIQGDAGNSMFILATGKASVRVEREGRAQPVGNLVAGDCFGEISLLTGEPEPRRSLATFDCEVLEIEKETMGDSIAGTSRTGRVPQRDRGGEAIRYPNAARLRSRERRRPRTGRHQGSFLRRLRKFFQL